MIANNYFSDNEDMQLNFNELIDWEAVVNAYENGFEDAQTYKDTGNERLAMAPTSVEEAIEYYRALLESNGELAGKEVSQTAREMDQEGLKFANGKVTFPQAMLDNYAKFQAAGLIPFRIQRELGGLGLPETVIAFITEINIRADSSFAMTLGLLNTAQTLGRFGSDELREEWVPKQAAGDVMGAMALTEPNYGSDLQNIRTKAVKQEDGTYLLTGTKRFISQGCGLGDRPCILLTLARTGDMNSGARGLSFFVVHSKDVQIAGIEHKLGIKCSPTCEVVYDNSPGILIGEEGKGLTRYAMALMNGARISVGSHGVGIGTAAYHEAAKYASEREQFGKVIQDIPAVKKMLDHMEREVAAMRMLHLEAAFSIDMYEPAARRAERSGQKVKGDKELKYWEKLATLLTPLTKFYCSEKGDALASEAIQVHGGSGYTEEYDVARIFRDSRINAVYEGTTQLQVVAAIGGVTAGLANNGFFRKYLEGEMAKFTPSEEVQEAWNVLNEAVESYKSIEDTEKRDRVAFEVVEIAARFVCGMLLERSLAKVSGAAAEKRRAMSEAYNTDTVALITGHLYKIKKAARGAPVAV